MPNKVVSPMGLKSKKNDVERGGVWQGDNVIIKESFLQLGGEWGACKGIN